MREVAVAVPTIVAADLLERCLASVMGQERVRPDVLLIENGPSVAAVCARWEQRGVAVHRPGRNMGVAASWNHACRWAWHRGHDAVILMNDDVQLAEGRALAGFLDSTTTQPRQLFLANDAATGFSMVGMSRVVWEETGGFDEGFWPAYFEDNDMRRRIDLAEIPVSRIDLPSTHVHSASVLMDQYLGLLNRVTFTLNQRRYIAKWGGAPGGEMYRVAWNGGLPWPPTHDLLERAHSLRSRRFQEQGPSEIASRRVSENVITVVTGLPRSGTSMIMQMLAAGGMPLLIDTVRQPDEDNPRGYFELEAVKQLERDASWLKQAEGKAVKVVCGQLRGLPTDRAYQVVVMRRNLREVIASQAVWLERHDKAPNPLDDASLEGHYRRELMEAKRWLAAQPNVRVLEVDFHDALYRSNLVARDLNAFLGGRLDTEAMLAVPDLSLYRQRRSTGDSAEGA